VENVPGGRRGWKGGRKG
jgi:hypothetical protein